MAASRLIASAALRPLSTVRRLDADASSCRHYTIRISETFAAWYGGRSFNDTVGEDYRTTSIELREAEEEVVVVSGLGEVTAVRSPFVQRGHASSEVRTRTVLRITFDQSKSLSEALDLCLSIELLFGFLTGFRPKFPVFHLWWARAEGDERASSDAELELGGVSFRPDKLPHFLERLHMKGRDAAGLKEVLEVFAADQFDFATRIAAVQTGRWFGGTLNEKFAAVMPVLEELLKARFKSGEETSYLAWEQAFFAYVDAAEDPAVGEFARKHLEVKDRKSPGLPMLIARAIKVLNDAGFVFGADIPKRINKRRASMFHSSPLMDEGDVKAFYEEASAAIVNNDRWMSGMLDCADTATPSNQFDLARIIAHEAGHVSGLDDIYTSTSTTCAMYGNSQYGYPGTTLCGNEGTQIKRLYGIR